MATDTSLNQIVKGAPPPGTKVSEPAPLPPLAQASSDTVDALFSQHTAEREISASHHQRPARTIVLRSATASSINTDNLPSSPPQIYLNLLILESSLRQQYLTLLSRRRLNTFFIALLALWNLTFSYFLFLRPREDGSGKLGGSPYWVVEAAIRLSFIAGVVASLLIKATGQWEAGVRWPRKWLSVTNRGLRGFNLRAVVVKRSLWKEATSYIKALAPWAGLADGSGDWHLVESPPTPSEIELGKTTGVIVEEDLSPSGDLLLLLLLPKNFSSEFRENWETYRSEYWERENERRASLRGKVAIHKRNKAKEVGGWKWWTGAWRVIPRASHRKKTGADLEKHPHGHHHAGHHRTDSRRNSALPPGAEKVQDALAAAKASRRPSWLRDSSAHSRQSSRSSTPHYMLDGAMEIVPGDSKRERVRRGSSVSSTGSARRSLRSGTGSVRRSESLLSPLTMTDEPHDSAPRKEKKRRSRPNTPSVSSTESVAEDGMRVKREPSPA